LGDFNARIANLDIFHSDDYGFIESRVSKDIVANSRGKKLIEFCADFDLVILNGRKNFSDSAGNFTFIGDIGFSVVDYVLVSRNLFYLITDFKIEPQLGSDHFPILVKFTDSFFRPPVNIALMPLIPKLNWNLQDVDIYLNSVCNKFRDINFDSLDINCAVNTVIESIVNVAVKNPNCNFYEQSWFDAVVLDLVKCIIKL